MLTPLRLCWLVLAFLGAVWGQDFGAPGPGETIALITLAIWCIVETLVRRNWLAFIIFPAMVPGIGCAFPLYLFIRSRRIV